MTAATAIMNPLRIQTLRWRAGWRRRNGCYDRPTLRLFRRSSSSGKPDALLDYLLFRRDLGWSLHQRFVPDLLQRFERLSGARRWQAAVLLAETGCAPDWLWEHVDPGLGLTMAAPNQEIWRDGFVRALDSAADRGMVVVGNGATLIGSGLGERIDSAGMVVRFNQWRGENSESQDIGERLSVWVTSPAYRGPRWDDTEWVVVSGPEMCFRLRCWDAYASRMRRARPVLTMPLEPWRELVSILGAPPSAGVLTLAWLRAQLGRWGNISAAGIGCGSSGRYHHATGRLRAASRHDWQAEAALVRHWASEGLALLPTSDLRGGGGCPA